VEEEIDLRQYVKVLIRYWKWIVGLTLVAAVAAFVVSLRQPLTYEASAVVVVTEPRYQMKFDPRIETLERWRLAYKAFPTLATSDGVLQDVLDAYVPSPESGIEEWKLRTLSDMVQVTSEDDPSLVVLKARSRSPEDAAAITNLWADTLVQWANEIYGESEEDVAFFEEQVAQAERALDEAETVLIEFQARNQASIVSAQLESLRKFQVNCLADQRSIIYLVQDIRGLRDQLARQPEDSPALLADDLTTLFLQIKAFNAQDSAPIQLQVNSAQSLSNESAAKQVALLDNLVATLEARSSEIDGRLSELEPQILALQQQRQDIEVEKDRLTRARNLARDTYMTLARKLEEARISAQEEHGVLRIGSYGAVPERPVGSGRMRNTAVAGALGLMLGVFGAFAVEWWQGDKEPERQGKREVRNSQVR